MEVVVCTIDIETNEVIAQRFFCANISYTNHSNHNSNNNNNNNGLKKRRSIIGSGTSSANAYLNMIKSYDYPEKELKRDLYGYPINSEPMEILVLQLKILMIIILATTMMLMVVLIMAPVVIYHHRN